MGVSPSLKLFDRPLLGSLGKCFRVAYWEYHQTQDEPCSLETVVTLLYEYLKAWDRPVHLIGFPISRDPHKGGTFYCGQEGLLKGLERFQFLGIPTKGELYPH
ncbi:hypothetical protein [Synechococcus sp. WC10meta]|uniref:hypothetical protein n=1 Tax=Synechococcus sp. WC10meta TaxID=2964537 RepID=UPI0039C2EA4B